MAVKLIIRNGTSTPSAVGFSTSEPAWDRTNGKLYVKDTAGAMVEVGAIADASVALAKLSASARGVGYSSTILFG